MSWISVGQAGPLHAVPRGRYPGLRQHDSQKPRQDSFRKNQIAGEPNVDLLYVAAYVARATLDEARLIVTYSNTPPHLWRPQ